VASLPEEHALPAMSATDETVLRRKPRIELIGRISREDWRVPVIGAVYLE
jgi:hypothetical protein